jgi:uroporphyrinogen-III synthase
LESLRLLKSDLFGFTPVLLPSATLKAVAISVTGEQGIATADALVFPSPFAIKASITRCLQLLEIRGKPWPIFAVIGQGSYLTLVQELQANGIDQMQCHIVANEVEPFDAEHLAPVLAQAIASRSSANDSSPSSSIKVLLLQGDKSANTASTWRAWLSNTQIIVDEVQVYKNEDTRSFSALISNSEPKTWCRHQNVVYFTSSSSVQQFAEALHESMPNALSVNASEAPIALTIHPKISAEVQLHLGWKVVEIPFGPQALLNWLSRNNVRP